MARLNRAAGPDARSIARQERRGQRARAVSAGGVVIRHVDGRSEMVLGRRRRERVGHTWTLPKGTPSDGETVEQTALREVAEETGLEVRIVEPLGAINYFFTQSGVRIHKTVHFFLMEPVGGALEAHDHEFDEVRWIPVDDARELLTYPTEREVAERALAEAGIG